MQQRTRILCVDDDPAIRTLYSKQLADRFDVSLAGSGARGLELISAGADFTVVISDLAMPEMDGIAFFRRVRNVSPGAVRILITGMPDLYNAISAINEGHIFYFLTKPFRRSELLDVLEAALEYHSKRDSGSVEEPGNGAVVEVLRGLLGELHPNALSRGETAIRLLEELLSGCQRESTSELRAVCTLSQIGCLAAQQDSSRNNKENMMFSRTKRILALFPLLQEVAQIVTWLEESCDDTEYPEEILQHGWGIKALRIIFDYLALKDDGIENEEACNILNNRAGYDKDLLQVFIRLRVPEARSTPHYRVRRRRRSR